MQGSHSKIFHSLFLCLILSIFVNTLTSCNNGNSQVAVVQETELISIQLTATQNLTLVPETEVATKMPTIITLTSEPTKTKTLEPTATKMPTPTKEKSLIEGNIFFDPQSEVDIDIVVESPSPIDEPEKFAAWQNEYLKMINKKLETYGGPYMKLEGNGIVYEQGMYIFGGNEWKVMSSYQFPWIDGAGNEQTIINKTYIFMNTVGNKIPLTVTYTTLDSVVFRDYGYTTLTGKRNMTIRYEWEMAKEFISDPFIDQFLLDRDQNVDFDIWRRVFGGLGCSEEDIEVASKIPIVFSGFSY